MEQFDLVIRGGTVATAIDTFQADVGISDGRIAALARDLAPGVKEIDARGKLVLPGGIETHCHIAQESASGAMTADDYDSGSVSAAFGGNSCFIPFAAQHRGQSLREVLEIYDTRAGPKSVIDYSYHLIVSDPTETVIQQELPEVFERGVTSFKVFMTYDKLIVDDRQILDILATAHAYGGLTMVHAENNGMIKWMVERLRAKGREAPRYHAPSHPAAAEVEAIGRGIQLANFVGAPLLFVHVSTPGGARLIAQAQMDGHAIFGETCPQYLFLTRKDLDRPGAEGAKFCCSPPLRDRDTQAALWRYLQNRTLKLWSSDHAPYRFDASGKLSAGANPAFHQIANGMPGIELRLPLLFSEGVRKGRITLNDFVALSATNAARMFGLADRKGSIAVGMDADIAIWDPEARWAVTHDALHDNMDYTPYEGIELVGKPVTLLSRGEVIIDAGRLEARRGRGQFIKRATFKSNQEPLGMGSEFRHTSDYWNA